MCLMRKTIRVQGGAKAWEECPNEDLVTSFDEIVGEITRRGESGVANLKVRFPRNFIIPLKTYQSQFPFLDGEQSRNIACTLQLCDVNRWYNKYFDLELTAGAMWEWQITISIAAIVETLLKHYIELQEWEPDKKAFEAYIDEFVYKGLFDDKLQKRLHSLRIYRNKIHLYLNDHISFSKTKGERKEYNEAIQLLSIVRDILIKHWEWSETIKLVVSDYFKDQLSDNTLRKKLDREIIKKFAEKYRDIILSNESHDGRATIIAYGKVESPFFADLCFFPDNEQPVTFDFTAIVNLKIKYPIKNDIFEDEDMYDSIDEELIYIPTMVEESLKIKITGRVKFLRNDISIKPTKGIGMKHFELSAENLDYASLSEDEANLRIISQPQPTEFYSPKTTLLDSVKSLYSDKKIVVCNGIIALNENVVIIVDSQFEAQFYEQIFDLIQTNKSYTYKKIKFIVSPASSNVIEIAGFIHSARIRVVCFIKRNLFEKRECFELLLDAVGIIFGDRSYAMDIYNRKFPLQDNVSGKKIKVDRIEKENIANAWDNLIIQFSSIGIFILPESNDKNWLAGFFEPDSENNTIKKAIKDLSRLKDLGKHEAVFEQHSWRKMYSIYREIRFLRSRSFAPRQRLRNR